jgi:hypothetical protein
MSDQRHHHAHFPRIAVRFQALILAGLILGMVVGEPENTVPHSHNTRQLLHGVVVLQTRIHCLPDELRDLGPHSSLDVELGDRKGRQPGLTHGEALELASVKLIECTAGLLNAERAACDLGPQLLVIANLDKMFDAGHERRDEVRLEHLGCLFADDNLGIQTAEGNDAFGKPCGGDADDIGFQQGSSIDFVVYRIDA